jgi:hypothetical protein
LPDSGLSGYKIYINGALEIANDSGKNASIMEFFWSNSQNRPPQNTFLLTSGYANVKIDF